MKTLCHAAVCCCVSGFLLLVSTPASAQESPDKEEDTIVAPFLLAGKLADGEAKLRSALKQSPNEDQLLMELGFLQFFKSVERMGQTLYGFGPRRSFGMGQIPFLRLPVPDNPDPKPVSLDDVRDMVQAFIKDLDDVDETLSKIDSDEVRLPLRVMQIKLDFDGDGKVGESENLGPVLMQYLSGRRRAPEDLKELMDQPINFDRADVDWLRGYCCLLRSLGEVFLAYDETEFWDVISHRLFENGETNLSSFLRKSKPGRIANNSMLRLPTSSQRSTIFVFH